MKFSSQFDIAAYDWQDLKLKMLNWLKQFSIFSYLDSNNYPDDYGRYELLIGASASVVFENLEAVTEVFGKEWLFGHFNYNLKESINEKQSAKEAFFRNQKLSFFKPEIVIEIPKNSTKLTIHSELETPDDIFKAFFIVDSSADNELKKQQIKFEHLISETQYKSDLAKVKNHILEGDLYELNLCVGAFARKVTIDPFYYFQKLNTQNPAPFSAFYRLNSWWALSSSPERFLQKQGDQLLAQPMKGTIKRGKTAQEDQDLKSQLKADPKELAENVMITDLMRNDLARSCEVGSIAVPELFGVYTFPSLHTLISSVTGKLRSDISAWDAIQNAFPMGSMTGAPKKIVMEVISKLELSERELYSGCIGYCNPAGDFDFSVVIRTLLYNEVSHTLSYHTGGAITIDSDPDKEWAEIRLKALAMERLFS